MSRKMVISSMGAAIALMLASSPAIAKGHKHGPHDKDAKHDARLFTDTADRKHRHDDARTLTATAERRRAVPRDVVVVDRDGHRRIVTEYYSREGLPPGLARRESLPPGLARQLRERGTLPPGLQKRLTPIPGPLDRRLQPLPPYYSRYFAGRDLIVVDRRTNRIVTIIPNARP
jgi:hypothetical protein